MTKVAWCIGNGNHSGEIIKNGGNSMDMLKWDNEHSISG